MPKHVQGVVRKTSLFDRKIKIFVKYIKVDVIIRKAWRRFQTNIFKKVVF